MDEKALDATTTFESDDAAQLEELAKACERRGLTYGLLSRLTRREVDAAFLAELRGMRFPKATGNEDVNAGYRLIANYVSGRGGDVLTELAVDYVRTFIGAGLDGRAAAYPYESVYTSEKRLLMQDARDQVLAEYRKHGLGPDASWCDPEDHIAVELEFMGALCARAAEALRAGDEERGVEALAAQFGFVRDHLQAWVPEFTHDMAHFARTDLYRGCARLLRGFVAEDAAFLAELLG